MKSMGIVRRIDDLGRICIPKELRRNCGIREGEPLEMFISDEGIILKKYSYNGSLGRDIEDILEKLQNFNETETVPYEAIHKISTGLREAKKWLNEI